jgi:hypothetical protein
VVAEGGEEGWRGREKDATHLPTTITFTITTNKPQPSAKPQPTNHHHNQQKHNQHHICQSQLHTITVTSVFTRCILIQSLAFT